jgi:hypothetical protein
MRLAATLSLSALTACAQSFNIGQGGAGVYDDGFYVQAPEPIQVGRELLMNELPVRQSPAQFFLNIGTRGRAGPFALADGATVGSAQNPYTLRLADYGSRFTLHPAADTNAGFGPFTATNGAPVVIGNSTMTVLRVPPRLTVSLAHPNRIAQLPTIGIAPLSQPVIAALYDLRAKYVNLANRVDYDTAPAEMQGVPRIHSNITGNSFTPVVKTSQRDKQNATKGAELSAIVFLESVFGQAFRIRSQAITDGLTFHFQVPAAGDYVLCATQRVKDPAVTAQVGTFTAVWWTAFHFDGEHPLALSLTAENAITWREIFTLDKK